MMSLDLGRIISDNAPAGDRQVFNVEVSLRIDAAVSEERQQAKLFASLLADIARQRALLPPAPPDNGGGDDGERRGDLDLD